MRDWRSRLITALICLSLGCSSLTSNQKSGTLPLLRGSPPQIRERLLSHIPIGTLRTDATRIALELGLEPSPGPFGLEEDNSLRFQKEDKHEWHGQKVSLIHIECPNGVVEDIFCKQIGIGG